MLGLFTFFGTQKASAQTTEEKVTTLEGKVAAGDERVTTLEATVAKMAQLKISGYVQPQWQWVNIDTFGTPNAANEQNNRNFFTIRRGRIKFQHTTDNVYYTLYPDISESGVIMKEVYAGWKITPTFDLSMGAMNRPFGYEIAYSSSAREVTERSLAENRLFNGERDLGIQLAVTPTLGTMHPLLEVGIFNGSDNFAKGPVLFNSGSFGSPVANGGAGGNTNTPATNGSYFANGAAIGGIALKSLATAKTAADTLLFNKINANMTTAGDLALFDNAGGGFRQDGRELIGHIRLPFLLSDDFSFDVGGSWSIGGINEPTDLIGQYSGTNGVLVISDGSKFDNAANGGSASSRAGHGASGTFNPKAATAESGGFLSSNRSVFGFDAQFYLSVLPIGGSIIKAELYTGQVPFYGTSALFTHEDSSLFGAPRPVTILKNVMGFYAMLVQNITDMFQLGIRYDVYDPNTKFTGTDFATLASQRGITTNTGFAQDLMQSTLTIDANVFVSGAVRLMFDYDMVKNEDYTRVVSGNTITQSDPKDDRFTFRMQYKF